MSIFRILCFILIGSQLTDAAADLSRQTLIHDGQTRSYHIYIPSTSSDDARLPLVLALHGRSGNGQRMADLTGFNARAEQHGFLVAYPDGIRGQWNYLHGIPGADPGIDDVDFLIGLVDAISRQYGVDPDRRYVTGISNGGFMAQRLACVAENRFAAFASVAASGFAAMPESCASNRPIDALYMHGTGDKLIPWQGLGVQDARGNKQLVTLSVSNSMKFWSGHNRCDPNVTARDISPSGRSPGTSVKIYSSEGCADAARVVLYAIIGGGHNWPGVADFIPASIAGEVNLDIQATDVIWSFFTGK